MRSKIFAACCVSLLVTSMTFAIRAALIEPIGKEFNLSNEQMGWIIGTAFYGFAISTIIGGQFYSKLGLKNLLYIAFGGHLAGLVLTIYASGFYSLYFSTLLIGLANGLVEAGCNPAIADLYPERKGEMLNKFHFFFPGGIVFGGVIASVLQGGAFNWQWQVASILPFVFIYGFMFYNLKSVGASGQATEQPPKINYSFLSNPLFYLLALAMLLTASTELSTNQWIPQLLKSAAIDGLYLLILINGIMAIGRLFAGNLIHRLNNVGVLILSSVLACLGLYIMGATDQTLIGTIIFALGVCYFWPTMLATASDMLPGGGAVVLSILVGIGMLSTSLSLPILGRYYDEQLKSFQSDSPDLAELLAGKSTIVSISILPIILIAIFLLLYFMQKRHNKLIQAESV